MKKDTSSTNRTTTTIVNATWRPRFMWEMSEAQADKWLKNNASYRLSFQQKDKCYDACYFDLSLSQFLANIGIKESNFDMKEFNVAMFKLKLLAIEAAFMWHSAETIACTSAYANVVALVAEHVASQDIAYVLSQLTGELLECKEELLFLA